MDKRAPTSLTGSDNDDMWATLFALPETDYHDPELLDRFLEHPDPNPARDWLLTPTH